MSEASPTDWKAEHQKLQVKLDALHQEVADLKAAHEKALADHEQSATDTLAKAIADKEAAHKAHVATINEQYERAIAALKAAHEAAIAKLKADVLVPAMRDLHARQQADIARAQQELAAKQKAELDALA